VTASLRAALVAAALVLGRPAWAVSISSVARTTTTASAGVSAEELAEIAAALGADAAPPPAPPAETGFSIQSMLPDIGVVLDVALAAFSEEEPLQTGGHDPTRTGFNLQQLEMSLSSKVDPYFRFDANLVFAEAGVEIEEAYATTLDLPGHLQVRAGQFLTRFGRINPTHPHAWAFVDQPLAIGRVFGAEGNRGLGAELSWLSPLPWFAELITSVTQAGGEATARSFFGAEDLPIRSPLDLQATLALKQFFPVSEDHSLGVGLSVATGPNPTGRTNRTDVFGVDLYYKFRPITYASNLILGIESEWLWRRRQVPSDLLQDVSGYLQASLRFAARWAVAARFDLGTPETGTVADSPFRLDPDWDALRHRWTANLTFWPTEFSRLRLQGSADVPTWRDQPIWAAMLAAEFVVGAHGAHAF
jgi:hypothetical protein